MLCPSCGDKSILVKKQYGFSSMVHDSELAFLDKYECIDNIDEARHNYSCCRYYVYCKICRKFIRGDKKQKELAYKNYHNLKKHVTYGDVYFPPIKKFKPIVTDCNGTQVSDTHWVVERIYRENTHLFLLVLLNQYVCDILEDYSARMKSIEHAMFNNEYECMMCGYHYDSTPTPEVVYKHIEHCKYLVVTGKHK